jgi:hypothetical protein
VSPYLKKPFIKKGWWSGSRCRLSVQTPELPKNNNNNNKKKKKRRNVSVFTHYPVLGIFQWCLTGA